MDLPPQHTSINSDNATTPGRGDCFVCNKTSDDIMILQVAILLLLLLMIALGHYSAQPKSDQAEESNEVDDHDELCYNLRDSPYCGSVYLFLLIWLIGTIVHAWIKFIADESIPGGEGKSPPKLDPIHDFPRWAARVIVLLFVGMTIWVILDLLLFSKIERRFKWGRYKEVEEGDDGDVEAGIVREEAPLMHAQNGYQNDLRREREPENNWARRFNAELYSSISIAMCA